MKSKCCSELYVKWWLGEIIDSPSGRIDCALSRNFFLRRKQCAGPRSLKVKTSHRFKEWVYDRYFRHHASGRHELTGNSTLTFHDPSIYLCRGSQAAPKETIPVKSSRYNAEKISWELFLNLDACYEPSVTNATLHDTTQS